MTRMGYMHISRINGREAEGGRETVRGSSDGAWCGRARAGGGEARQREKENTKAMMLQVP
jgi:hypothetical protein